MSFKSKKTELLYLVLTVIIFCNCQPKTENSNLSEQSNEEKNQTAIRISAIGNDSSEPAITADNSGNIYIVFVEHNADKSADVYLQKFDKEAKPSGEKIRINPEKGNAKAWFGDPPTIKIGNDNTIYVGWTAKVESKEKPAATTLFLSVSRDGGKSFDAPTRVNDDDEPASHGMHSLAIGADEKVFMAWLDERNIKSENHAKNFAGDELIETQEDNAFGGFKFIKAHHNSNQNPQNKMKEKKPSKTGMKENESEPNSEIFFALSNDGGKTFSKNIKLSSEVCPCCKTNLAIDGNEKIYASWRQVVGDNFRHIAVASSENGSESFSDYKIVSDDRWQINACPVSGAAIYLDDVPNPEVLWFTAGSAGKAGLYAAKSNDGGKTFEPRELIYEGSVKGTPAIFVTGRSSFGLIFATGEEIIQMRSDGKVIKKFSGEFPAVTESINGAVYTTFVREENDKRSVWLSRLE